MVALARGRPPRAFAPGTGAVLPAAPATSGRSRLRPAAAVRPAPVYSTPPPGPDRADPRTRTATAVSSSTVRAGRRARGPRITPFPAVAHPGVRDGRRGLPGRRRRWRRVRGPADPYILMA
ncbi:hypothetical protein QJS66_05735 [Kocuria rhizophila]|nr:hypothetical protein QJS66_05735 [Kocuria rhizophila]